MEQKLSFMVMYYDDACAYALKLAEEKGYTFVHPFDDLEVATGQGTYRNGDCHRNFLQLIIFWFRSVAAD